ncbi:MAG TPA: hypothetical protein VLC28_16210, partial [Flavitalea sp.]|nr:hypothetical protein [Flavitalea sp.]
RPTTDQLRSTGCCSEDVSELLMKRIAQQAQQLKREIGNLSVHAIIRGCIEKFICSNFMN